MAFGAGGKSWGDLAVRVVVGFVVLVAVAAAVLAWMFWPDLWS